MNQRSTESIPQAEIYKDFDPEVPTLICLKTFTEEINQFSKEWIYTTGQEILQNELIVAAIKSETQHVFIHWQPIDEEGAVIDHVIRGSEIVGISQEALTLDSKETLVLNTPISIKLSRKPSQRI